MANSTSEKMTEKTSVAQAQPASIMTVIAPAVGWLIPGAGHMIQKRWIRGLLLFISITTLFVLGLAMQGRIYKANGGDILDILGFIGDVGAGGLYILTLANDWGRVRHRRLWNKIHDRRRLAQLYCRRRRLSHCHREETMKTLSAVRSQLSAQTSLRSLAQ
jgi:hypothetical protein